MKLRVHDDSIRFRLTRSEVEKLLAVGRVESTVRFNQDAQNALTYALEASPLPGEIRAQLARNEIRVILPANLAQAWATTDQVAIEHLQPIGPDSKLRILVEKDFRCLHPDEIREQENATDFYPNPNDIMNSRK